MNLEELRVKPQLVELEINDPKIVETYGDTIKFWMYDHLSLPEYFAFFRAQNEGDIDKLLSIMRNIILNAKGKPVMSSDYQLPVDLFAAAVTKVAEQLGKSETKKSIQEATGTQP